MAEAPRILLEHHLKRLKLPTFLREYEKLARQCAAEGLDHVQFLARLVEMEMIDRERRLAGCSESRRADGRSIPMPSISGSSTLPISSPERWPTGRTNAWTRRARMRW